MWFKVIFVFSIRPYIFFFNFFIFLADKPNPFLKSVCSRRWSDRPGALLCAHLIPPLISFRQTHSLVTHRRVNTLGLILATALFSCARAARWIQGFTTKWAQQEPFYFTEERKSQIQFLDIQLLRRLMIGCLFCNSTAPLLQFSDTHTPTHPPRLTFFPSFRRISAVSCFPAHRR